MTYELTEAASTNLFAILDDDATVRGASAAEALGASLMAAFRRLAEDPGLGHKRSDLTPEQVYFYLVDPYFVIYKRLRDPLPVVAIYHSSRDIRQLLRRRR